MIVKFDNVALQSRRHSKQFVIDELIEHILDKGGTVLIIRPEGNEIRPDFRGANPINMRLFDASEQRTEITNAISDKFTKKFEPWRDK